jgi:hypothetical protein
VSKNYQKTMRRDEPDPQGAGQMDLPEQVLVSLAEIAESAKDGLLALSGGVGLQVMYQIMEEDVAALRPEGKAQP